MLYVSTLSFGRYVVLWCSVLCCLFLHWASVDMLYSGVLFYVVCFYAYPRRKCYPLLFSSMLFVSTLSWGRRGFPNPTRCVFVVTTPLNQIWIWHGHMSWTCSPSSSRCLVWLVAPGMFTSHLDWPTSDLTLQIQISVMKCGNLVSCILVSSSPRVWFCWQHFVALAMQAERIYLALEPRPGSRVCVGWKWFQTSLVKQWISASNWFQTGLVQFRVSVSNGFQGGLVNDRVQGRGREREMIGESSLKNCVNNPSKPCSFVARLETLLRHETSSSPFNI